MSNIFDKHDDTTTPKKRRNINTINRVVKLLEVNNMNTREIHEALHTTWPRWCPSMPRLGNLLSRGREFVEVGKEKTKSNLSGNYDLTIWGLTE